MLAAAIVSTLVAANMTLGGCISTSAISASGDVHALAVALRDGDIETIAERVDQDALQAQVSGAVRNLAQQRLEQMELPGGFMRRAAFSALDRMDPAFDTIASTVTQPRVLAQIARFAGLTPDRTLPGQTATAYSLKRMGDGRVCLPGLDDNEVFNRNNPCVLYFTDSEGGWRLSAIDERAVATHLQTAGMDRLDRLIQGLPNLPALPGRDRPNDDEDITTR